jgi:hypothetical protein
LAVFLLRPNAQGTYSGWTPAPGPSKPVIMSDASDSTWIQSVGSAVNESYQLANLPANAGVIIGSVVWHCRMNKAAGGSGSAAALIRLSGVNLTAAFSPGLPVGSFVEQTATFANPPGGGLWTPTKINSLEAGITSTLTVNVNAADIWITGNYQGAVAGLGFVFM